MEMVRLYPVHNKKKKKNRRASNWHRCFILSMSQKSTSGNISYHFFCVRPSHQTHLIQSCLLTEAELRHDFFFFFYFWWLKSGFLFTPVCQAECSSRRAPASRVLCPVMLTANWSWSRNVLHFIYKTERGGEIEREPESLLSAVRGWHEFKHTDTHTHLVRAHSLLANVQ